MRRRGQAEKSVPGLVDRSGERVEVEHRHRAEIRQGFHQRQRDSGANGRPGHRERDTPERLPGRLAKHPRGFHQTFALRQERRARQQVDIRIENQHQHKDDAARGAHARQPQPRAKPFAHQCLHRPGEIQQADENEGQHVGWNREWQHQRPI